MINKKMPFKKILHIMN